MRKKASGKSDLAQYFTPQPVAAFVLDASPALGLPRRVRRVVDPACGQGVFLREARRRFPEAELWGCDLDPELASRWRAAGLSGPRAHMLVRDGLRDSPADGLEAGTFDLVVGNPPYGFRVPRRRVGERIEVSFLKRFVELARPGGWIGVVVPEGIVANVRAQVLRDWLLEQVALAAVVALSEAAFAGRGTQARTAVLLACKGREARGPVLLASPARGQRGRDALRGYLAGVLEAIRSRPSDVSVGCGRGAG